MLNLEPIKARAEAASPGPWFWNSYDGIFRGKGEESEPVAWIDHLRNDDKLHGDDIYGPRRDEAHANARFVEAAREDIPALIAEVERLRKESE